MGTRVAESGLRFEFGSNWSGFLRVVDDERIGAAERSLREMLGVADLRGQRFLDVGSGSGLFSLAARRLGATVHSFDYDPRSVGCTAELRRRYRVDDPEWTVQQGSVLDQEYLASLGTFDVVYAWGVLHHTGAMWQAMANVAPLVSDGGKLFVALYNDQGASSRRWLRIKRTYCASPAPVRWMILGAAGVFAVGRYAVHRLVRLDNPLPVRRLIEKKKSARGMSFFYDLRDWVGGYPFEVATREAVVDFYGARGFTLVRLESVGSKDGNNQFVFGKPSDG